MATATMADDFRRHRELLAAERDEYERLEQRFGDALDAMTPEQIESALLGVYGRGAAMQAARLSRLGLRAWIDRLPLLQLIESKTDDGGAVGF